MRYYNLLLPLLLNCGCAVHKIQNVTQNNQVCEFQISGISDSTYYNDLLPRLNRLLKSKNLISANDSAVKQKDLDTFKFNFFVEKEKFTNISEFVSYYKIFTYEVFDSGGNFSLKIYKDQNKILIYQYSRKTNSTLFETQKNYVILKKYLYKIK